MRLTKHLHACITLEKDGSTLLIDPGTLTPNAADLLRDCAGVLVTHEHFDHYDADALRAALAAREDLVAYGPAFLAAELGDFDGRVRTVVAGDAFEIGTFSITTHGSTHAVIHADIPTVGNIGFIVDGAVYHPGDAYFVPEVPVPTLLVPVSGPWTKFGDAVDFIRAVAPERSYQIHEQLLSELGQNFAAQLMGADGLTGIPMSILAPGESVEV